MMMEILTLLAERLVPAIAWTAGLSISLGIFASVLSPIMDSSSW